MEKERFCSLEEEDAGHSPLDKCSLVAIGKDAANAVRNRYFSGMAR